MAEGLWRAWFEINDEANEAMYTRVQNIDGDENSENYKKLCDNLELLCERDSLLGETLLRMLWLTDESSDFLFTVLTENFEYEVAKIKEAAREFVDLAVDQAAEYHADEVKRRGDRMYEEVIRRLNTLSEWRHRLDKERGTNRGGTDS